MAVAGAPGPVAKGRRGAVCALTLALGLVTACSPPGTSTDQVPTTPAATSTSGSDGPADAAGTQADEPTDPADTGSRDAPDVPDDEHSAVRSVVDGFPVDLLPLPDDAMILVTSAVPVGSAEVQEVSLNLRTQASTETLMELYRESLIAAGFTEVPPQTPHDELAAESTFTRSGGDELVSIGVLDAEGLRTVTIGGRLRTDR